MTDHIIALPDHFSYTYQFEPGRSQYRCVAATLAMAAQVAYPGRWQSPGALMHDIYTQYAGDDIPSNQNGMSKEQAEAWLQSANIGYIDMSHLLGDPEALRAEISAQNRQNVCQLICVADESKLRYARNRADRLHNWSDGGLSHAILRIGYSDSEAFGYYEEPAASLAFAHPLPILWEDIVSAGIITCIAIMPHKVAVPPAGFSFQSGQWPTPEPPVNIADALNTLHSLKAANDAERQRLDQERQAADAAFLQVLRDLGAAV